MQTLNTVHHVISAIVQQVMKACLALDPGTRYRLQTLNGKVIAVKLNQLDLVFYVCPTEQGIELQADSRVPADVFVVGDPLAFLEIILADEDYIDLSKLDIDGDTQLFIQLHHIVKELDLDWEGALAPLTGDVLAHQIGKNVRATEKWLQQSLREAKRLAEEYMEEEYPVARESEQLKPVFEGLEKAMVVGESVREQIADAIEKSPLGAVFQSDNPKQNG